MVICVFKTHNSFDAQNAMYVQLVVHVLFKNFHSIRLAKAMNELVTQNEQKKPKNIGKSKRKSVKLPERPKAAFIIIIFMLINNFRIRNLSFNYSQWMSPDLVIVGIHSWNGVYSIKTTKVKKSLSNKMIFGFSCSFPLVQWKTFRSVVSSRFIVQNSHICQAFRRFWAHVIHVLSDLQVKWPNWRKFPKWPLKGLTLTLT